MNYAALLKRLQKMTPEELRQRVTLKEGCSDNITHVTGVYTAKKREVREELVENAGLLPGKDGCQHHWEPTGEVMFKRGQVWLLHDH